MKEKETLNGISISKRYDLACQVKLARQYRGYTQTELSKKSGISQSVLSMFEKGVCSISDKQLQSISTCLDFPITFFFKGRIKLNNIHICKIKE